MNQILWNVLIGHPDPVNVGIDLLHFLDVVLGIQEINEGASIQRKILHIEVGIGDHILLEVIAQQAGKNAPGEEHHRQSNQAGA